MRNMEKYYYGKVCEKHPEEGGLRDKRRRMCLKCHYESARKSVLKRKMKEKQGDNQT